MKLKTRILIISVISFVAASLISNFLIWRIYKNQLVDIAIQDTYTKAYSVTGDFARISEKLRDNIDKIAVEFFFKSNQDDYTICVCDNEEYYNHTVFSAGYLDKQENRQFIDGNGFQYSTFEWKRKPIVCIYSSVTSDKASLNLYRVADISNTYSRIYKLGFEMLGISAVVIVLAALFLYFTMKRSFKPLGKLSEKARLIADGKYNERIAYSAGDEVGLLAADFNKMASAVEEHTRKVEESEAKKTMFMGSLMHELKTPLTAISGYAQTLRNARLSPEDTEEALYYIDKECGRLGRLSRKIMNLLELEHDDTVISMENVPVSRLFSAASSACTQIANEKNIVIEANDGGENILCDADLMTEVLVNLIDNAVKASAPGATVRLYTESAEDSLYIVVRDFGCGIADENIGRIFEPFYMADKSRSRKSGGAGLGLAISAAILEKHGYTMAVKSSIGEGTEMRIYISMISR